MLLQSQCGKYNVGCFTDKDTTNVTIFVTDGKEYFESVFEKSKIDYGESHENPKGNNSNKNRIDDIIQLMYEPNNLTTISAEIKEDAPAKKVPDRIEFWAISSNQRADTGLGSFTLTQIVNNHALHNDNSIGNKIASSMLAMSSNYNDLRLKYDKCLTDNSTLTTLNEGLMKENERLRQNKDNIRRDLIKQFVPILNAKKRKR